MVFNLAFFVYFLLAKLKYSDDYLTCLILYEMC